LNQELNQKIIELKTTISAQKDKIKII